MPRTVLIVEDDEALRLTLTETLRQEGCEVTECGTIRDGMRLAASLQPTLVVCDVHLADGDGRKVLTSIRENDRLRDCQFVMMTGDWVGAPQLDSIKLEADAYLAKPFTVDEFMACVRERFRQADL
jgi:DNA-binding response OmpR family regulator